MDRLKLFQRVRLFFLPLFAIVLLPLYAIEPEPGKDNDLIAPAEAPQDVSIERLEEILSILKDDEATPQERLARATRQLERAIVAAKEQRALRRGERYVIETPDLWVEQHIPDAPNMPSWYDDLGLDHDDPGMEAMIQEQLEELREHVRSFEVPEGSRDLRYRIGRRVELRDDPGRYVVVVEMPGSGKENIGVRVHRGILWLRGERPRPAEHDEPNVTLLIDELHYGFYERNIPLPGPVDSDATRATYEDGVLKVVLPKAEDDESAVIPVE